MRLSLQTIIIAHSLACAVAIATTFGSPLDSWLSTFGYCQPADPPLDPRNGLRLEDCVSPAERYKASLSWGLGILVDFQQHPSPGPLAPHYSSPSRELPLTVFEEILVLLLKLACLFAWTVIFGNLLAALTQADPDRMRYQNDLDSINRFCDRHKLSSELTLEVRRYFFQTLSITYAESRKAALEKLSVRASHERAQAQPPRTRASASHQRHAKSVTPAFACHWLVRRLPSRARRFLARAADARREDHMDCQQGLADQAAFLHLREQPGVRRLGQHLALPEQDGHAHAARGLCPAGGATNATALLHHGRLRSLPHRLWQA